MKPAAGFLETACIRGVIDFILVKLNSFALVIQCLVVETGSPDTRFVRRLGVPLEAAFEEDGGSSVLLVSFAFVNLAQVEGG